MLSSSSYSLFFSAVPLSLSRTFVVSRAESVAGSPGIVKPTCLTSHIILVRLNMCILNSVSKLIVQLKQWPNHLWLIKKMWRSDICLWLIVNRAVCYSKPTESLPHILTSQASWSKGRQRGHTHTHTHTSVTHTHMHTHTVPCSHITHADYQHVGFIVGPLQASIGALN